ncbi:MAG: hypothetical protein NC334_09420 [Bacteroides sp.]|nr:hypothetical protein [Bacteroides sp.]
MVQIAKIQSYDKNPSFGAVFKKDKIFNEVFLHTNHNKIDINLLERFKSKPDDVIEILKSDCEGVYTVFNNSTAAAYKVVENKPAKVINTILKNILSPEAEAFWKPGKRTNFYNYLTVSNCINTNKLR